MNKARALWLWGPWALFLIVALGWTVYWNVLATRAQARLESWMAAQTSAGAEASVRNISRSGYPALLKLNLVHANYVSTRGGWRASTDRLAMHVDLLNPQHVVFDATAPILIERSDGAVTELSADRLIGSVRTSRGVLAVAGVEADNLRVDDPAQAGVLTAAKLVANVRQDPRAASDYQLALELQSLLLPRDVRSFEGLGREVPQLRAAIVITAAGAALQPAPNDPLGRWREAGGRMRFEALTLHWGRLETTARGEGGLDAQRRLEGHIEAPIEHPAPVITAIANAPDLDESTRRALALLAAGFAITGDDVTIDAEARDGVFTLEGLPVRVLGPVY